MFVDELTQFHKAKGKAYDQAVDAVLRDLQGDDNVHGNITRTAQASLDKACEVTPGSGAIDIEAVIADHPSPQPISGAPARTPPDEPLRQVVPYSLFLRYHIGMDSERTLNLEAGVRHGKRSISRSSFNGTTGRLGYPSWWTWGSPPPAQGRDYVEQLALPEIVNAKAAEANGVAEVTIPQGHFPAGVFTFKPSALDGFGANTRFEPDLTDSPHGWTKPANPSTHPPRPELVSRSFAYADLPDEVDFVSVVFLAY